MTWLFIEPSDVWLFRDSRPFAAGEGHAAASLYPPSPFTVQGALRSWLLGREMVDWRAFAQQSDQPARDMAAQIGHPPRPGAPGSLGKFRMRGPFRARQSHGRAELLYPAPADIYHTERNSWRALRPSKTAARFDWGADLSPLLPDPTDQTEKPDEENAGVLDPAAMSDYLAGRTFGLLRDPEFHFESRLGIAMDYGAGRAADRMLYLAAFARLDAPTGDARYGLLVEATDALDWPEEAVISLGGEMRAALVRRLGEKEEPAAPSPLAPAARFKVVLLTPAWFSAGREPAGGWPVFLGVPGAAGLRCVAAAVGRANHLGGWNAAGGGHKSLRGFVPPGSVFYFEADQPVPLPDAFTETPDQELDIAAQGFGAFVAGPWAWLAES